jgi:citrate lyase subunit beta/citryl-CoA lyase
MRTAHRPRRSVLYMPGANPKALEKAKTLPADALILDLEDAVAPEAKEEARTAVAAVAAARPYGRREVIVRVNGLETPWGREDVAAAAASGADALLFPKIAEAGDVLEAHAALRAAGAPELAFFVMIETPAAILSLREIAAACAQAPLAGFVVGTNDLAKEMRVRPTPDRAAFTAALSLTVLAARAHGLAVMDGVFNDVADAEGLERECAQGAALGFDGKTLIHPSQIEAANRLFAPSPADIAHAQAVIAAFEAPENAGKGVLKVDGRMVERLHLEEARRLATVARAIAEAQEQP